MSDLDKVYELINKRSKDNMFWLADNMVFLVESGSRSYGTNTPESDKDYKGVVIPPIGYHIGLHNFKSVEIQTGTKDIKNSKDDIDITLYSLNEFVRLALNSNPNIIEMLYVERESILIPNEELVANRDIFLTNRLGKSYGGYGYSMMKRVEKGYGRGEYLGKDVMNAVRIFETGREALLTGTMSTKRPNKQELLSLRHDKRDLETTLHLLEESYSQFKDAEENSVLPNKPDFDVAEELLMGITRKHLNL